MKCTWNIEEKIEIVKKLIVTDVSNMVGIVLRNRIVEEVNNDVEINLYGHSLIINEASKIVKELNYSHEGYVITYTFDIKNIQHNRAEWELFRDRRNDFYYSIINN